MTERYSQQFMDQNLCGVRRLNKNQDGDKYFYFIERKVKIHTLKIGCLL